MKRDGEHSATQAIEAERAQVANEVHDAILPLIVGAKAALESHLDSAASQHADREKLAKAFAWLDQALQAGRELLVQTYPPELSQTTWHAAAQDTIARLSGDGAKIEWEMAVIKVPYSKDTASAAYRIVVEAVRNAIAHGQASLIVVKADSSSVSVSDNGKGFDPSRVSEDRYGIRSMKGRAQLAGGTLHLDSKPDGPTKVSFSFGDR
ncbi:MAG: ATP-binding protein [Pirellulaceae bacterium]